MFRARTLLFLAGLLALLAPGAARAQGLLLPRPIRPIPQPVRPLAVKSQKVMMHLDSGALKVEVEQVFYNPNPVQMEGTYLFPLPEGAAVSSFRMTLDKEPVEGKLLSVDEARRIYESYVRRNIDPAILEYVGRNAFQARVFPILPSSERHIFLTYSQPAAFDNGVYRAVYPLNAERVTGQTAGDVSIDCTIRSSQPLKTIYSPTHEIQVKRETDNLARVTFEGKDVRADRDFLLYYTTSEKAFGLNALTYRRPGEDGYAMLMLAPKREAATSEVQPKDIVFVFDTSGS
ncbi:MAG TPA: VIT domain-containing protein, partial [Armatimonadota bacterium]|nr:VIT domain-containing protein [Armatimonadota bacterium]